MCVFFVFFLLQWASIAMCGLSRPVLSRGSSLAASARASPCSGFSCCEAEALGHMGSVVVAHRLSCSVVCGIFPDQG